MFESVFSNKKIFENAFGIRISYGWLIPFDDPKLCGLCYKVYIYVVMHVDRRFMCLNFHFFNSHKHCRN